MKGWVKLTIAANGNVGRYNARHILRYAAATFGDDGKTSIGLTNGGSIRVIETVEEIDNLIEQAS